MKKIKTTITIDSEIWKEFLKTIIEKYGHDVGKGKKKALDEALKLWIKEKK